MLFLHIVYSITFPSYYIITLRKALLCKQRGNDHTDYRDDSGEKTIHVDDEVSSYIYLLLYNNINPKECKKESLGGYYYNIITPTNIISTYTDTDYIEPDSFYIVYNDRDYDIYSELFEKIKEYIEIGSITIFIS